MSADRSRRLSLFRFCFLLLLLPPSHHTTSLHTIAFHPPPPVPRSAPNRHGDGPRPRSLSMSCQVGILTRGIKCRAGWLCASIHSIPQGHAGLSTRNPPMPHYPHRPTTPTTVRLDRHGRMSGVSVAHWYYHHKQSTGRVPGAYFFYQIDRLLGVQLAVATPQSH